MPGSLFREWKVALAFVAGIAMLAGAFVSDGGEYRYFERFKSRDAAPEAVAAPATPVTTPVVRPAYQSAPGSFSSDDELEAAFSEPEAVEVKREADPDPSGSPDARADAAIAEPGAVQPAGAAAAAQP